MIVHTLLHLAYPKDYMLVIRSTYIVYCYKTSVWTDFRVRVRIDKI